jgi:hypothetical protein
MKKLLLSLVLMVAGLVAMAQENEIFAEQGEMVRKGYNLCFAQDGFNNVIPDAKLEQLLDEDACNGYYTGKALYRVGDGIVTGSWIALGFGAGVFFSGSLLGYQATSENIKNLARLMQMLGAYGFYEGIMSLPAGYILRGVGASKIRGVADDYNQGHQNTAVSYRISPCLMPVNVASQNNVALGMTLSVSF